MKTKVIFLDVDGTLCVPRSDVSKRVKQAIQEARENHHYVFLCTGRIRIAIQHLMSIGFDGVISSAGGYVEVNNQMIYETHMTDEDVQEARNIFERNHVMYTLECQNTNFQDKDISKKYAGMDPDQPLNSEMARMIKEDEKIFNIQPISAYDKNPAPVYKMSFFADKEEDLIEPRQLLSDKYEFIVHEIFSKVAINGEIIMKGMNKGLAIEKVVKHLGLSMEDTICFGDSMNDYEMIRACHYSVVMENGSPELKKYATTVCESVYDDGIYHELKRLKIIKNESY